jgi:hypothetical protein
MIKNLFLNKLRIIALLRNILMSSRQSTKHDQSSSSTPQTHSRVEDVDFTTSEGLCGYSEERVEGEKGLFSAHGYECDVNFRNWEDEGSLY